MKREEDKKMPSGRKKAIRHHINQRQWEGKMQKGKLKKIKILFLPLSLSFKRIDPQSFSSASEARNPHL